MLTIKFHSSFKKDYKRVVKRGYNVKLMEDVIIKLAKREQLPENTQDFNSLSVAVKSQIKRAAMLYADYLQSQAK